MKKPTQKELNKMLNSSQIHSLMSEWAKAHAQKDLRIKTVFDDNSELIECYAPAQKDIEYKVIYEDMEIYTVSIDVKGKYICNTGKYCKDSVTIRQIIQAEKDFMSEKGIKFKSVTILND